VYNLKLANKRLEEELDVRNTSVTCKEMKVMISEQVKLFIQNQEECPDYRSLLCENEDEKYFLPLHEPLVKFFESVIGINNNSDVDNTNEAFEHKQRLKLQSVIAILCNIKNPKCIMFQNMIGMSMFANGLRDAGFRILNMFGVSCSAKHVRSEASKWSKTRNVIHEVTPSAFWRVTLDNLNFKRHFAKTFRAAGQAVTWPNAQPTYKASLLQSHPRASGKTINCTVQ
jgi:hypothetical protein